MIRTTPTLLAIVAAAAANAANALEVELIVNETVCTGVGVQCGDFNAPFGPTGHTNEAAAASNHNPVAVYVYVTLLGRPVVNLPASAFRLERKFAPATAPGFAACNDAIASDSPPDAVGCGGGPDALFQNAGGGVYGFYLHPSTPGFDWAAGKYTFTITVGDQQRGFGRAFGAFVIPE